MGRIGKKTTVIAFFCPFIQSLQSLSILQIFKMSITLQQSPPLVAISGNPVCFKLYSDNKIETPGVPCSAILNFGSIASDGDTLTLSWGYFNLEFTFKDSPDNSGMQLPTSPINEFDWTAVIGQALALNYYIDQDFIVSWNATDVTFVSRTSGSTNTLTAQWSWTGTEPTLWPGDGQDEVARTFFKIGLQVLIKEGESFTRIGEDSLPLDANDFALFDIRNYFADQLVSLFKFPDASDQLIIHRPDNCREYRVRYFERFGLSQTPQKITESDSFFILKAGISYLQEAIYNRLDSSLWEKITYNDYSLTWQPKTKY